MKKLASTVILLLLGGSIALAQPEINIVRGSNDTVRSAHHFIRGLTSPDCHVTVNNNPATVYSTGAFAAEVILSPGYNDIQVSSKRGAEETVKGLQVFYQQPEEPKATNTFIIEDVKIFPENI